MTQSLRNSYLSDPFIKLTIPKSYHLAVGPCPYCNRLDHCVNDIPLTAYCGGSEEEPHKKWEKVIPSPYNPYLNRYKPSAIPSSIEYEDRRSEYVKHLNL